MNETYKIIRFYRDDRSNRVLATGLTREAAQAHCQDEGTRGFGYFDGFEAEQ